MTIEDFESQLKILKLKKKEFASMVNASYTGVVGWNTRGVTPEWVDSWLFNYAKAKKYDEIRRIIEDKLEADDREADVAQIYGGINI
ncbi:hypothetical protein LS73_001095 [Helicobacter muridarum]|uniref:Uncharacterized protein n=1 Tax=Helicobacter muridarum TaxID=216 RepID=A0A099TXF1_9HELI|nr:hypothetical protein [Helicobacter muridarum]TLE01312.1 hypothetical protein LS73_001095 [Helicobacter muridarum]STQ87181.1 Uncharacterised protein [Helicobacter muridarum]